MKLGFLRRASTGAAAHSGAVSLTSLMAEFVVVVAGILVALGVDDWRQHRQELTITSEHLRDVAFEVSVNLRTVEKVQQGMEGKRQGLEAALRFLKDPSAPEADPGKVLQAFAVSAIPPVPWLRDNQFKALQNSGNLRLLRNPALADDLADNYAMAGVLFSQVDRLRGSYPAIVQELIPASIQSATNPLLWYIPRKNRQAPVVADDEDYAAALDRIRARSAELLPLARGEAGVYTAEWYALERMRLQLTELLKELPPVDSSPTPEQLSSGPS